MEITWYGHSCFHLAERGLSTVVTDPYNHALAGYEPLALKADIVTISRDAPEHSHPPAVLGHPYLIQGPGEFEIGGVFITGIQTSAGAEPGRTLYVLDYNNLTVAHLGSLERVPAQAEVEAIGPVHIALLPVGGSGCLNAPRAAEMVSLLEPKIVIPMHYATPASALKLDPLNKFLKEMGISETEMLPTLKITSVAALPEETRVIVLDYRHN